MKYNEKYFYTLKEFLAEFTTDDDSTSPFPYNTNISIYNILDTMNSDSFTGDPSVLGLSGIKQSEFTSNGTLNVLWSYIITKYKNEYVGFGEYENLSDYNYIPDSIYKTMEMIVYKMVESYPRYKELLDLYNDERDHLMDDIKSWTRFNDTPQLADTYKDEKFATNYTEYGNQYASKIARIKEIDDEMRNLMGDWCDEFARCFIE